VPGTVVGLAGVQLHERQILIRQAQGRHIAPLGPVTQALEVALPKVGSIGKQLAEQSLPFTRLRQVLQPYP
jgi:hypothetical protein